MIVHKYIFECTKRLNSSIAKILYERGMLEQYSHSIDNIDIKGIYWGFDPTGPSFHLGHMLGIMTLVTIAQTQDIKCVALVGEATALIGDPSMRQKEREYVPESNFSINSKMLTSQLKQQILPNFHLNSNIEIQSNKTWYDSMNVLDFFRDVGRYSRISTMLHRDSVQGRLSSPHGMGYHEFSYSLFQGYDFYELYTNHGINVQLGGNDQWGNMMAGLELIEKKKSNSLAHVLTNPLLLTKNGSKFGKTEAGDTIWLNPLMTSPYELYQYMMNIPDDRVKQCLLRFTLLSQQEIDSICKEHFANPSLFLAQKILSQHVTRNVHGQNGLNQAQLATRLIFQKKDNHIASQWINAFKGTNRLITVPISNFSESSMDKLLVDIQAHDSIELSRNAIQSGSVYINGIKMKCPDQKLDHTMLLDSKTIVIFASGKHQPYVLNVE